MQSTSHSFSFRSRVRSLYFAMTGILEFLREEHNARIHLVATIAVGVAAYVARVTYPEAAALAIVVGLVWITEMLNTCVERIMDFVQPEEHPKIKFIKDLAAGAVLAASFTAVVVGLLIFIPKFK
ncbi:MAG TPA: diacylglycerol kinase family protein [Puia sp.]|nr:diacylglycerol kinase family protein [Puia sp.]